MGTKYVNNLWSRVVRPQFFTLGREEITWPVYILRWGISKFGEWVVVFKVHIIYHRSHYSGNLKILRGKISPSNSSVMNTESGIASQLFQPVI